MQQDSQSGFTMVEIAVAFAIVCLAATIMVMGQNLTVDSQVDRLEHDFRSIQTAIYDSRDEMRLKRGDARKVSYQLQDSAVSGNSSSLNEIIDGNWNSSSGVTFQLWLNVRPAGLAKGREDKILNAHVPLKLPGGVIGVSETYNPVIDGLKGNYAICTSNIAGQLVKKLDLVIDDGNTASGSMRITNSIGGMAIATDSIVSRSAYMVCMGV